MIRKALRAEPYRPGDIDRPKDLQAEIRKVEAEMARIAALPKYRMEKP